MQTELTIIEIAARLRSEGYIVRDWSGDTTTRLYISRELSRGRKQDMGYIEQTSEGEWRTSLTRAASTIQSIAGLTR